MVDQDDRQRQFARHAFNNVDVTRNFGAIVDEKAFFLIKEASNRFRHVLVMDLLLRGASAGTTTAEDFWPNEEFPIEDTCNIFEVLYVAGQSCRCQ